MIVRKILTVFLMSASLAGPALSHDHAAHQQPSPAETTAAADPQAAIPAVLKAMFEKPDNPLSVAPVVVSGDWAVADWSQGNMGGRALLKKRENGWAIHLCSGASLKDVAALRKIGIADADANALATSLASAESNIGADRIALFDSFEGTVMMEK